LTRSADIKNQVRRLLKAPDLVFAASSWPPELENLPAKPLFRALLSGLCAPGEDERWRAVGLLGLLAARLAGGDLDIPREVLRRLMWGLNEESGAIVWAAPQAMGEILFQVPALALEYGRILCSYLTSGATFLDHPPLQAGLAWALGRLALAAPEIVSQGGGADLLLPLLAAAQAEVRGCAAWALGVLAEPTAALALAGLTPDPAALLLLMDDSLQLSEVGKLASWAIRQCKTGS